MKKIITLTLLLAAFSIAVFAQETTQKTKADNKPKATYRVGQAKITVWVNKGIDNNEWKNFKVEKIYKKNEQWKSYKLF